MSLAAAALVVAVVTLTFGQESGSSPATVDIRGLTYGVLVARTLDVEPDALSPFDSVNAGALTLPAAEGVAYQIAGVDPAEALVVPLVPGARDDSGPLGEFALLHRGSSLSNLCHLFRQGPGTPEECQRSE
jgi:hypothetical protein